MIVYMIMDSKTGKWWYDGLCVHTWVIKQENATIWTKEQNANIALKQADERTCASKPVKMRFVLAPMIEEVLHSDVVVVDKETWVFAPEYNAWFWGTENNGCGVYSDSVVGDYWEASVVIRGECTRLPTCEMRDKAMRDAVKFFKENK